MRAKLENIKPKPNSLEEVIRRGTTDYKPPPKRIKGGLKLVKTKYKRIKKT